MKYYFEIYENEANWEFKIWRYEDLIYTSRSYASAILAMEACHNEYLKILKRS